MALEIHPATPDRWADLAELFGPRGAYAGCWCMWNRQTSREFEEHKGEDNRRALEALVAAGEIPGLLAYGSGTPVGWVSVGPREVFSRLQRSRVTRPVDHTPVWAVTCFVIDRAHRNRGVATALLAAAVAHAAAAGAVAVEGYPVEPRGDEMPPIYAWMGLASMFTAAGFVEIARRSPTRPLMRKTL
jgi:GNAT superfamily N-acetyltransferase